jgi:hypothetical protein
MNGFLFYPVHPVYPCKNSFLGVLGVLAVKFISWNYYVEHRTQINRQDAKNAKETFCCTR